MALYTKSRVDVESQQTTNQIVETEASKNPSNQINNLQLKFGVNMQKYISPKARISKQVMKEKKCPEALWNLQKHLL